MKHAHSYKVRLLIICLFIICFTSCKKFLEIKAPATNTYADNVFSDDAQAASVLNGIYAKLSSASVLNGSLSSLTVLPGLSADELSLFDAPNQDISLRAYYSNSLTNVNTQNADYWYNIYPIIFITNATIEGLSHSNSLTNSVKQQLMGEAKFIRGFCYFYLANLYGDVPLALTTAPETNRLLTRSTKQQVYQQIVIDLVEAQTLLSETYLNGDALTITNERIRPNKWTAAALLARVYLYINEWAKAETQATTVINNGGLYDIVPLNDVFLKESKEAIWQLQPVLTNPSNTMEARLFMLPAGGPNIGQYPVFLSENLVSIFENSDERKDFWIDSVKPDVSTPTFYYAFKYKNPGLTADVTEYNIVFRLAEQYLIRAEARAQLNNFNGSQDDLNKIRTRAGLTNIISNDKNSLIRAIQNERRVELFTEWGHRWFDLRRTNTLDETMQKIVPQKGGVWNSNWAYYPINSEELKKNPNLKQNSGY